MYSSDQIKNIKVIINSYFENKELQSILKKKIKEENIKSIEDLNNEKLIELLKDVNLLDQILIDLSKLEEIKEYNQQVENRKEVALDKINKRAIGIKILQGQAFVDYLIQKNEHKNQYFQLSFNFQNQSFHSKMVPVSAEPQFNETFIFDLQLTEKGKNIDLLMFSKLDCQIELVLLLINEKTKTKSIFSIKQIEWRHILCFGQINLNIELLAYELQSKLIPQKDSGKPSVGVLQVHMDLLPKSSQGLIPEKFLNEQLLKEKKYRDIEIMQFYEYSQEWWSDYKSLNPNFDQRPCKIYAENEDGIYLPVSCYLTPLWGIQGIDSPYHASRFVSLIPLVKQETPGGERIECWQRFHTFLCQGKGDFETHALLLNSFLLGFGMDAYVVVGTSGEGPHLWVLVRSKNENNRKFKYTFWESLTGQRYDQKDPRVNGLYRKIGCIFNHESFYANIQSEERAFHVDLNLDDQTKWKSMELNQIQRLQSYQPSITLFPSNINYMQQEKLIEQNLKYFLTEYRKSEQLLTRYDDKLAHLLMPSLTNYEFERITGKNFGIEEFQQAIKSYVPIQYTFKAFPIQFLHQDTEQMFIILKNAPICQDIILTRGDKISFGIKSKMCLYPNDFYAVWIIIAVTYISLD